MGRGGKADNLTLDNYQRNWRSYQHNTPEQLSLSEQRWLQAVIDINKPVLEIGSGTGRTADYLERHGLQVQRSDAVSGFIDLMNKQQLARPAIEINLLKPYTGKRYPLIVANAVLLHFNQQELQLALTNIASMLTEDGELFFSVKRGDGQEIKQEKGMQRLFNFWQPQELSQFLNILDWQVDLSCDETWIHGRAKKSYVK